MVAAPLLAAAGARVQRAAPAPAVDLAALADATDDLDDHVVIAGFGRVGQTVAKLLSRANIDYVALDRDMTLVDTGRQRHLPVYFGDATRPDILRSVGIACAQAVVVTLDHADAAERLVAAVHDVQPGLAVVARARDFPHAQRLLDLGAVEVVVETLEASLELASHALRTAAAHPDAIAAAIAAFRAGDSVVLEELAAERRDAAD